MHTIVYQQYGPGKFPSNIEEWFYQQSLEGCEDEASAEGMGWYGLLLFNAGEVCIDYEDLGGLEQVIAAIVQEHDSGFVDVYTYQNHGAAKRHFQRFTSAFSSEE